MITEECPVSGVLYAPAVRRALPGRIPDKLSQQQLSNGCRQKASIAGSIPAHRIDGSQAVRHRLTCKSGVRVPHPISGINSVGRVALQNRPFKSKV